VSRHRRYTRKTRRAKCIVLYAPSGWRIVRMSNPLLHVQHDTINIIYLFLTTNAARTIESNSFSTDTSMVVLIFQYVHFCHCLRFIRSLNKTACSSMYDTTLLYITYSNRPLARPETVLWAISTRNRKIHSSLPPAIEYNFNCFWKSYIHF